MNEVNRQAAGRGRLDTAQPIWERFYWVAPLVLVGTMEAKGGHDLAPKPMAQPLGWNNSDGNFTSRYTATRDADGSCAIR